MESKPSYLAVSFEAIAYEIQAIPKPVESRDLSVPISQIHYLTGYIQQLRGTRLALSGVEEPNRMRPFDRPPDLDVLAAAKKKSSSMDRSTVSG